MPQTGPLRVFLSYDKRDSELAHQLANELEAAGYDVFPGTSWPQTIEKALKRANAMVVLVSSSSMKSPWVMNEVNYALGSQEFLNRVVPVFLEAVADVPWILKSFPSIKASANPTQTAQRIRQALESAA